MRITPKQYAVMLYEATKDAEKSALTRATRTFIEMLAKNRALAFFPRIVYYYQAYYNRKEKVLDVAVASASALSPSVIKHVKAALSDQNVECVAQTDPALLGGARIRIGDYLFDDTIKARLSRLRSQLYGR